VTELLCRHDAYLLEFDANVVGLRVHQGQPAVVLDRTAFYAEGGGQPWDTGTLGGVPVVAVLEHAGEVLHVLAGPLQPGAVRGHVDATRRRDHIQQHHGQHLLSRAFVETAGAATRSFHLGADDSTIDLDREIDDDATRSAEQRVNQVIWESRPVSVRTVARAEADALGVKAAPEAGDTIRLIEVAGFDLQACSGTHPRRTGDVGVVAVIGHERYKGGSRVRFLCGQRVLSGLRARSTVLDQARTLLSSTLEGVPEAVAHLLEARSAAERRAREAQDRAIVGEAHRLLAAREPIVVAAYDGWEPGDLRTLALALVGLAPCLALLGSRAGKAHLVFAQSKGLSHDVPGLLREALATLGGRGGGKGDVAQGGGEHAERLDEVLAAAAAKARVRTQ